MPLLLDAATLAARRALVEPGAPFAAAADGIAAELDRAIAAAVGVPREKAVLTRVGGRCPVDGTLLVHDPYAPHAHRCARCGAVQGGAEHDRWWVVGQQLWLAERALHAATLAALRPDDARATAWRAFAGRLLDECAERWAAYPNADNALGPTRPFFSTYLESCWLLHLVLALDLLEGGAPLAGGGAHEVAWGARIRERLVAPSAALIASFPEGRSNRQAWHVAARLAAGRLGDDAAAARAAVHGADGLVALLSEALAPDGCWFEGEHYHQFAHRGLWYGVTLAEAAGAAIDPALLRRFDRGFAVPFATMLPDGTAPARRDARYAVSLRQWRWAEWAEVGRGRALAAGDVGLADALDEALGMLYAPDGAPAADAGRWRATGEAEREEPPVRLARGDLSWKSLLFADPAPVASAAPAIHARAPGDAFSLGAARATRPASVSEARRLHPVPPADDGGIVTLRSCDRALLATLDYGQGGGGHGHPDRLNLTLYDGVARWVDDPGAGSYTERALHWYRSTLAHCAPLADGASQPPARGVRLAVATDGPVHGASAAARIAPGVRAARTLVLVDAGQGPYLVDRLVWAADGPTATIDLPLPIDGAWTDARGAAPEWAPFAPGGAGGLEDGFDFLHAAAVARWPAARTDADRRALTCHARAYDAAGDRCEREGRVFLLAPPDAALWRAHAPGPPGHAPRRQHAVRSAHAAGELLVVWDPRGAIVGVARGADGGLVVHHAHGRVDRHRLPEPGRVDDAWTVDAGVGARAVGRWHLAIGDGHPPSELPADDAPAADVGASAPMASSPSLALPADGSALEFALGADHWRRTEVAWADAGCPAARVAIAARDDALHLTIDVALGRTALTARPLEAMNPYDNERAQVNGDGVQLAVAFDGAPALAAWLLVPDLGHGTRVHAMPTTPAAAHSIAPTARWGRTADGWTIAVRLPCPPGARVAALDVLVNEMPPGRERRRGQLALRPVAGADAWAYLRGDRHDATRLLRLALPPHGAPADRGTAGPR